MVQASDIKLSKKQLENINFDTSSVQFELNEGSVRSGKTMSDIWKMAKFYMQTEDEWHLISAYSQEQAYRMFIDGEGLGLMHVLKPFVSMRHDDLGDHLLLSRPDGRNIKIYYKGGGKVSSVGAITGMGLGSVVYLEFNLLHPAFIAESLRRTIASKQRYHLAEQNPPAPNHPNLELIDGFIKDGQFKFRHWRMKDNPVLSKERRQSLYVQMRDNKYLLNRDWFGIRVMPDGVVYSSLNVVGQDADHISNKIEGTFIESVYVGDGGSSDATTVSFNIITHDPSFGYRYYRVANYYHSNYDTGDSKSMDTYAREIIEFMNWCGNAFPYAKNYNEFFIDPACKALRLALEDYGVDCNKADNNNNDKAKGASGTGSKIEVGIEYGQTILDTKRFALLELDGNPYGHEHFIKEAGMYVRHDETKKPIDKNNHAMDEFRYMNNYFYKNYVRRWD